MTAVALTPLAAGDPARYAALAAALALARRRCSACSAGSPRLGFLADLLSKPVLVGYMAGVAVIMIVGQLGKVTGVAGDGRLVRRRAALVRHAISTRSSWPTVLAGGRRCWSCCSSAAGSRGCPDR